MGNRYDKHKKLGHAFDPESLQMARDRIKQLEQERGEQLIKDWQNAREVVSALRLNGHTWFDIGTTFGVDGSQVKALMRVKPRPKAPEFVPVIRAIVETD